MESLICTKCGKAVIIIRHKELVEVDNALSIKFEGGYGWFVDPLNDDEADRLSIILCHECAHQFCDDNPWLTNIIEPHTSHSHTHEYQDAHPEHYGWDYDFRRKIDKK